MRYYLFACERSTGIILMQDCVTRFLNHDGITEMPYMEIEAVTAEVVRQKILALILLHPEVEVTLLDAQKNYVQTYPIEHWQTA